ncbi:hypothetical protein TNCV_4845441 [Trichonephila clavipes]|uniref:Uncharacterized protein n=1 Tax=Trichonephila clavipes TaxID=2585209 RepID=A0A8X6WJA5_TRICX|nr:hypothetical protein TNCV_4845441 [Trichonephila clavipes]
MESPFISRREQLESVSSPRERSVDICSRLLPLDERLYLAPSASSQALECLMATRVGPPCEGCEKTQSRPLIGQIK